MDFCLLENYIVYVYMWLWFGLNFCDYFGLCFYIMRIKFVIFFFIKGVMWGGGGWMGWDGDIIILEIICRCVDIFLVIWFGGGGGVYICIEKKFIWEKNL